MGDTRRALISSLTLRSARAATLAAGLTLSAQIPASRLKSIPLPGKKSFPESITSTSDGVLFVGRLGDGGIVRVQPDHADISVFIEPGALGSRSITGVFADEASNTLWACSNDLSALGGSAAGLDTVSALKAFDLTTGVGKWSIPLPGAHPFCNDIVVDATGAVYITDSANPTVLRLSPDSRTFEVFAFSRQWLPPRGGGGGLDGIAFGAEGNLYVTTYTAGRLFRVDIDGGKASRVTELQGPSLTLPDAIRPLGQGSLLLVEGAGVLDRVDLDGDRYTTSPIQSGFRVPTSVARVESTAWVSEGQLSSFFGRSPNTPTPTLPFRIYAVPLSKGQDR